MSKQAALQEPYVPANKTYPELTLKAIVLGIILAAILGGSNAYLGLKIGQTITACIPAAIISMAILGMFKKSNILENNIVQTMASAGEVMAAAAIFTFPALLMIGYWDSFSFLETALITVVGGFIGIFFSIPLRRALIVEEKLTFPEGVATAEVLKAGATHGGSIRLIMKSGIFSALIQFGQAGLQLLSSSLNFWFYTGNTVFGIGTGLSPVMIGAGYIVGLRVCLSLVAGAITMYWICIPLYGAIQGLPEAGSATQTVMMLKSQLKYIGVGAMIVGGVAALFSVLRPIKFAIQKSFSTISKAGKNKSDTTPRTERDIPFVCVLIGLIVLFIPVYMIIDHLFSNLGLPLSSRTYLLTIALSLISTFVIGFLVASIAGYMSGLVGNSSNPVSGILIASVVLMASIFLLVIGTEINFTENTVAATGVAAAIILTIALIACIGVISCDNLQDLKSGYVLGATPWKQQIALFIGVIVSALIITPVLQILFEAYGMGGIYPREGMDPGQNLSAPQAVLIATVTKGMIGAEIPLNFIFVGGGIGIIAIIIDRILKRKGHGRFPALGVALGLYLPLDISVPIFIGGLISTWAARRRKGKIAESNGILFASGMIAGEALMGIFLAIPFAAFQSTDVFKIVPDFLAPFVDWIGLVAVFWLGAILYRVGKGRLEKAF